jgi:hypothetical protein
VVVINKFTKLKIVKAVNNVDRKKESKSHNPLNLHVSEIPAMKTVTYILSLLTLITIFFIGSVPQSGCSPDRDLDTIPTPPPPPGPEIISFIKTLEESFESTPSRKFSFYYDAQKRVTHIGIKQFYASNITDSFTTRFFYAGSNKYPYQIIRPHTLNSPPGNPYYDTSWITYNVSGLPVKDSSRDLVYNNTTNLPEHKPLVKNYIYLNNSTLVTEWYGSLDASNGNLLVRKDTVVVDLTNGVLQRSNSQFLNAVYSFGKAENFSFTSYINPLAKLNISGSIFSNIYSPVRKEILGNSLHPTVWNSNTIPYYLDFINKFIPSRFHFGAFYTDGTMAGSGVVSMDIVINPSPQKIGYPAALTATMAGSLPGTTGTYTYTYYD